MIYVDTSALVPAITDEANSERVWGWLARQDAGSLFISDWTHPEVASALSIKVRTGQLSVDQRALALSAWNRLQSASLHVLAVTSDHFSGAAVFATRHELGIRSGDALHLAVAAASGFRLLTLDKVMAAAAPILGIPVEPMH